MTDDAPILPIPPDLINYSGTILDPRVRTPAPVPTLGSNPIRDKMPMPGTAPVPPLNPVQQILIGCDWDSPQGLVDGLVQALPSLGLYAYEVDVKGDCFDVVISRVPLTKEQVEQVYQEHSA